MSGANGTGYRHDAMPAAMLEDQSSRTGGKTGCPGLKKYRP